MTQWTPDVGELFFAECLRTSQVLTGEGATATLTRMRDTDYATNIFRLVAMDDRALVADIVYGPQKTTRRMLLRVFFVCKPVGPAVAEALGLNVAP